jgi:L-glutamine-phosphate cytidylyltransferase
VKVALLAAGLGSRLGALTTALPKALIPVGDRTLLAHALGFAARLRPAEIVVVGGFCFPLVEDELEQLRRPGGLLQGLGPVTLVENPDFRQGNLLSLQAARPRLEAGDQGGHPSKDGGFVLLNVDHIYRPSIATLVAAPADFVTAFVDTDRALGNDDMKVKRDPQGRVARIAKTLTEFDAGYVGMTSVPGPARDRYFAETDAALASEGPAIHVERVLARLADAGQPPLCRDISGHGWLEVDTPSERAQAENALSEPGWK